MTRHLTSDELAKYRDRSETVPQQLLRLDRHLAECPECLAKLRFHPARPVEIHDLAEFGDAALHPAYEQLSAYVEGEDAAATPELQARIEQHLLICANCADEAGDLRVFSLRMSTGQASSVETGVPRSTWLDALKRFLAAGRQPGLALASLCLLVVGAGLITRVRLSDPAEMAGQISSPAAGSNFPSLLYIGIAAAVLGLAGLVYRGRK